MWKTFAAIFMAIMLVAGNAFAGDEQNKAPAEQVLDGWKNFSDGAVEAGGYAVDNIQKYNAFCSKETGVLNSHKLCKSLQYSIIQRGKLSILLHSLEKDYSAKNKVGRNATKIGMKLIKALPKIEGKKSAVAVLNAIYRSFSGCDETPCTVTIRNENKINEAISALVDHYLEYGGQKEVEAATAMREFGY